jgi:hypothetical protein
VEEIDGDMQTDILPPPVSVIVTGINSNAPAAAASSSAEVSHEKRKEFMQNLSLGEQLQQQETSPRPQTSTMYDSPSSAAKVRGSCLGSV